MRKSSKFHCLILVLLWGAVSCQNNDQPPDPVLPESEFVNVLVDLHLIEGAFNRRSLQGKSIDSIAPNYYQFVLEKYQLTAAELDSTFAFYLQDPERLDKMYEEALNEIGKLNDQTR